MQTQLKIEPVTPADISAAGELMEVMWREHGEKTKLIDTSKILAPTGPGYIHDFLRKPDSRVYVAKLGDEVVGVVSCLIQPLPTHYKETTEAYIDDLCVDVRFRRHGVGSQLVRWCEDFAKSRGISVLSTKIWSFNVPSEKMFEQNGYENSYSLFHKMIKP